MCILYNMGNTLELECLQKKLRSGWNFIIAQMVRGQLDTEKQMKPKERCHVHPHWENHMLFV